MLWKIMCNMACFEIVFKRDAVDLQCYSWIYTIDAGCSSDNATGINNLEVRYDLFGDGNWDTDFNTEKTRSYFWGPKPPNGSVWNVIIEIKDEKGNTSTATLPMDTTVVPSPDIWVGKMGITKENNTETFYDEVKVGETFFIQYGYGGTGDFFDLWNEMHLKVNGELIKNPASIGTPGCVVSREESSFDVPGNYTVSFEMDVLDNFNEANENNNSKSFTFQVIE